MLEVFINALASQINGVLRDTNDLHGIEVKSGRYFITSLSNIDHVLHKKPDNYANTAHINGRTRETEVRLPVFELEADNGIETTMVFMAIGNYRSVEGLTGRLRFTLPVDHIVFGDPDDNSGWGLVELEDTVTSLNVYEVRGKVVWKDRTTSKNQLVALFYSPN